MQVTGKGCGIARGKKKAVFRIFYQAWHGADCSTNGWQTEGHSLEVGNSKPFIIRGYDKNLRLPEYPGQFLAVQGVVEYDIETMSQQTGLLLHPARIARGDIQCSDDIQVDLRGLERDRLQAGHAIL